MHKDSIRVFLKALRSKPTHNQNRVGWIIATCPYAPWKHDGGVDNHPSFGVQIKEGDISRYNCFSCNSHGDLGDMITELAVLLGKDKSGYDFHTALQLVANEEDELEMVIKDYQESDGQEDEVTIFPDWWLDSFQPALESKKATKYLKGRGLTKKTITALDIRYDSLRNRVSFPIRDWDNFLVGLHGRSIDPNPELRYYAYGYKEHRNKLPWVGENRIDPDKMVVLCEGPFDMAAIYQVYPNVICSNSASMSKAKVKRICDIGDVVTMYDYGMGGDAARAAIDKYLHGSIKTHLIPSLGQGDPGSMTPDEIRDWIDDFT